MKQPTIYIMSNKRNGTLYVGVTSDLIKRVYEHKDDSTIGFTARNDGSASLSSTATMMDPAFLYVNKP